MKSIRSLVEFGCTLSIFAIAACGAVVRPEDAHEQTDASADSGAVSTGDSRPSADADAETDVGALRNESIILVFVGGGANSTVTARLIRDEPVPIAIDSRDGRCRTYDSLILPETRAGTLTVRIGSAVHSIDPHPTRERNPYSSEFTSPATAGTRFRFDAEGSATFPSFSITESVPAAIEIIEPSQRAEIPWNSRVPIVVRWRSDSSSDAVQVVLHGRASATEGWYFTVCSVPISQGEFEITSTMLGRYNSLTEGRRIDVLRVREARTIAGNAPIWLSIRNIGEGGNWISFR